MKFSQVKEDLEKLDVGEMIEDEPMYKHTTYKVGGPARIYLKVKVWLKQLNIVVSIGLNI